MSYQRSTQTTNSGQRVVTRVERSDGRDRVERVEQREQHSSLSHSFLGLSLGQKKDDDYEDNFADHCLKAHNELRAEHGAPPLKLNKKLCKLSEEWAEKLAKDDKLSHRPDCPYGENVFMVLHPGKRVTASEVVGHWYKEIEKHTFLVEPPDTSTGHFCQVVWFKSQELGVGIAKNKDSRKVYIVCNYDPPGNFVDCYAENVPPLGGFPKGEGHRLGAVKNEEQSEKEFAEDCLQEHNKLRAKHGVPSLRLSKKLCEESSHWAKKLASREVLESDPKSERGGNLYMVYNPAHFTTGAEVAQHWYSEEPKHDYTKEPETLTTGHFTQVVWKDTEELGVGRAKSKSGKVYIVAYYYPPGNYRNCYMENVLPPKY